MTATLPLADHATRDDLRIFLERLQRSGEAEVRLVVRGSVLAVYGCTQAPRDLLDPSPVVLVMRAFALRDELTELVDVTVQGRALLDRIARLGLIGLELDVPDVTVMAVWAGVLPPTSGWEPEGAVDGASIATVAADGIARVAAALPDQPGEAVVQQVRHAVWGTEVAPGLPAAAAFAAEAMGFLVEDEPLRLLGSRTWKRLSSSRGHVLIRSSAAGLSSSAGLN